MADMHVVGLDKAEVGRRCQTARKSAGLTLRRMADALGYRSSSTISNKEAGLAYPSLEDIVFLSRHSGYTISWLVTGEEESSDTVSLSANETELVRQYRLLSDEQKTSVAFHFVRLKAGYDLVEK